MKTKEIWWFKCMKWELINLQSIYGQTFILTYTMLLLYNILYSPLSVLFEIIYFHYEWNKRKLEIILRLVLFEDDLMTPKRKIDSVMPCSTNLVMSEYHKCIPCFWKEMPKNSSTGIYLCLNLITWNWIKIHSSWIAHKTQL